MSEVIEIILVILVTSEEKSFLNRQPSFRFRHRIRRIEHPFAGSQQLFKDSSRAFFDLTSVLRGKSQSTEIVVEGIGDGMSEARTMEKAPSEKDRLKAAELLGKRYGIYTDEVEADVDMELNINIDYGDGNEN